MSVNRADDVDGKKHQRIRNRAGRKPAEVIVLPTRRRYTGATGASIGDVPEREAFDRGSRVIK